MLISKEELELLGSEVVKMLDDEEYYPDAFWILSQKIIHGIIYSNKKMIKFPSEWKDLCEHNAIVKVHGNIRKFSPKKWNEARNKYGLVDADKPYKGIYEFIHLMVSRNIYNTIKKLITTQTREKGSCSAKTLESFDVADITALDDFRIIEDKINIEWLDKRLGFATKGEDDE